jgi:hypothetical protein
VVFFSFVSGENLYLHFMQGICEGIVRRETKERSSSEHSRTPIVVTVKTGTTNKLVK